ncbi:hypothetical protein, partial [Neisseria meningitidis]
EAVDVFGNHGLCGLLKEGAHEKSPKCLGGNLGDFGEFCKGLRRHFCQKGKRQYPLYTRKQSKDVKTVCIS